MEAFLFSLDVFFMIILLFSVIRKNNGTSVNLGFFAFLERREKTMKK